MHCEKKRRNDQSHTSPVIRVLALLLVLLLILPLFAQIFELAFAIDQAEIDAMKARQAAVEQQIEAYNDQLDDLKEQENSAAQRYDLLTDEIDYLNEQIDASEALLEQYREDIARETLKYQNAQQQVEELTAAYTAAVRAMETQGFSAYWSAILNSNSIVELVQTLNDLKSVTAAQQRVIDQMEEAKAASQAAQDQISQLAEEQKAAEALLQQQRRADEESLAALDEVIAEINANQAAYADQIAALEGQRDDLTSDILEAETQLAIQREAERRAAEEAARKAAEEAAAKKAAEEAAKKAAEEAAKKAAEEEAAKKAAEEEKKKQEEGSGGSGSGDSGSGDSGSGGSGSGSSSSSRATGQDVVDYAVQFVGNPYVWGGTSLTNGCDCSGFVMKVYEHFGYSLPHYSGSQAKCGIGVSYSEAKPGDIICYSGHVGIYIGKGQMVNAFNEERGIIICAVSTSRLVAVRRIIY